MVVFIQQEMYRKVGFSKFNFTDLLYSINPSNAEATFVQSTRMQQFLKTI